MAQPNKTSVTSKILSIFGYEKREYTLDELFDKAIGPFGTVSNRFTSQREQLKAYVDWVYAAASAIAQDAAVIDLIAYANRSGKPNGKIANQLIYYPRSARALTKQFVAGKRALEELDNHVLLDLLDNPNPVQDADTFREMAFLHLILSGEAFWYKEPGVAGRPQALWPLMPYLLKETVESRRITRWSYRVGAEEVTFTPDEIVHIKLTDPNNLYRGVGVVRAAARAINTGASASDWNEAFFRNSARPDIALETDSKLDKDVVDRLKEQWSDNYQGTTKAHKVAVLEQGLKLNRINITQKEMDFLESMKFNRDQQLAMFKTSRTMLGIVEGDGRSNMEAAEYNQSKRVIRPLMRRFVSAVNHSLAPVYDAKLVIGFTDPVPEDKEFLHKERIESVNKYRTINEVREEAGLEPIPGGDILYQANTLVPVPTSAPSAADSTDPSTAPDDTAKSLEGEQRLPKPRQTLSAKSGRYIAATKSVQR